MKRTFWQPRYFLVSLIALALVVLGVRLESLARHVFYGTPVESIAAATAEDDAAKAEEAEAKAEAEKHEEKEAEKESAAPATNHTEQPAAKEAEDAAPPAENSAPPPDDLSQGEMEVLKQLAGRRAMLDQREQEISQKSAILQAAELRVDQKVKEMEKLRSQLQTMLGQLDEAQQTQIDNLVKMFETMKPKEAARILQSLDMPVLLGVMRQMKPAKSAPIVAEMDAPKAKDVTMALVQQHDIPDAKALK